MTMAAAASKNSGNNHGDDPPSLPPPLPSVDSNDDDEYNDDEYNDNEYNDNEYNDVDEEEIMSFHAAPPPAAAAAAVAAANTNMNIIHLVGANRKSAFPATPSGHRHHHHHDDDLIAAPIRRTPRPPGHHANQQQQHYQQHHHQHQQQQAFRSTPGAEINSRSTLNNVARSASTSAAVPPTNNNNNDNNFKTPFKNNTPSSSSAKMKIIQNLNTNNDNDDELLEVSREAATPIMSGRYRHNPNDVAQPTTAAITTTNIANTTDSATANSNNRNNATNINTATPSSSSHAKTLANSKIAAMATSSTATSTATLTTPSHAKINMPTMQINFQTPRQQHHHQQHQHQHSTPQISNKKLVYDNNNSNNNQHQHQHHQQQQSQNLQNQNQQERQQQQQIIIQSREQHRQKHLYTPAHQTLLKNSHLHDNADGSGGAVGGGGGGGVGDNNNGNRNNNDMNEIGNGGNNGAINDNAHGSYRPDLCSPNTIRMTESLDKLLDDDDDDDDDDDNNNDNDIRNGGGIATVVDHLVIVDTSSTLDEDSTSINISIGGGGGSIASMTSADGGSMVRDISGGGGFNVDNANGKSTTTATATATALSTNAHAHAHAHGVATTPTASNANCKARANSSDWTTSSDHAWFNGPRSSHHHHPVVVSASSLVRNKGVRIAPVTQIDQSSSGRIGGRGRETVNFRRIQSSGPSDSSDDEEMDELGDMADDHADHDGHHDGADNVHVVVVGFDNAGNHHHHHHVKDSSGVVVVSSSGAFEPPPKEQPNKALGVPENNDAGSTNNVGSAPVIASSSISGVVVDGLASGGSYDQGIVAANTTSNNASMHTAMPNAQGSHPPHNNYAQHQQHQQHHDAYFLPPGGAEGVIGGGAMEHQINNPLQHQQHLHHTQMFPHHVQHDPHHNPQLQYQHHPLHHHHHHPFAPSPPTYPLMHQQPSSYSHLSDPFNNMYTQYPHSAMPSPQVTSHASGGGFGPFNHHASVVSPLTIPSHLYPQHAHAAHHHSNNHMPSGAGGAGFEDNWNMMGNFSHSQHSYAAYHPSQLGMGIPGHSSPELLHPIPGHVSPAFHPIPGHDSPVPPHAYHSHTNNYPPHVSHQSHSAPVIHHPSAVPARHHPQNQHFHRNAPPLPSSPTKRVVGNTGVVGRGGATNNTTSSPGERNRRPQNHTSNISSGGARSTSVVDEQTVVSKQSPFKKQESSPSHTSLRKETFQESPHDASEVGIEACSWLQPHTTAGSRRRNGTGAGAQHKEQPSDYANSTHEEFLHNDRQPRGRGKKHESHDPLGTVQTRIAGDRKQGKKSTAKQARDRKQQHQEHQDHSQSKHVRPGHTIPQGSIAKDKGDVDARRGEFTETPAERQAFKEFGRNFRQKESESLESARNYALACISESSSTMYLPPATHWRVFLELADVAKRSNQMDNARYYYRKACENQPYASQGWLEHSKLEEECGNLSKCANILQEGLQYCTLNENLLIRAVKFYERIENLEQARKLLARLNHVSVEKSWKTMLEGALLEARAGRYKMARELLKYITFHVPWHGPLYLAHTKLERDYGSSEEAFVIVEKGLKELPRYGPLYFQAFRLCEKEDLSRKAFHLPRTMDIVSRADSISKELLWKVHLEAAQIQERAAVMSVEFNSKLDLSTELQSARRSYAKAIMLCPPNLSWKIWLASGRTEVSCDNTDEARALFLRAYDSVSEKSRSTVLLECARLEEFCGELVLARSILSKARHESGSNDWKVWLSSVNLECRCGFRERAIAFSKKALNIHSGTGRLWAALIQLRHEDGELHQMSVLKCALQSVPKSGEVWCEGARIYLNPFCPTFDLKVALRHLTFAARFTPQYGDSFLEQLRLDMINQWLVPLATPLINSMNNSFLTQDKMHLEDAFQFIAEQTKNAAYAIKSQVRESNLFNKDVLDTSDLELRCSSADPNYGHLWFQCRESPIDTAREVIARAKSMMTADFVNYSHIYVAAMVRQAGILLTIYYQTNKIIMLPGDCTQPQAPVATSSSTGCNGISIDAIVATRLRSAPLLHEMLAGNRTGEQPSDGLELVTKATTTSTFVTGYTLSNKTWNKLSLAEKRRILFGTDSLLS